jgi:hypothetical protein
MTRFLNEYDSRAGNDMLTLLSDIKMYKADTPDTPSFRTIGRAAPA